MLIFLKKEDHTLKLVEEAIEDCVMEMKSLNSDSDEYAKMNDQMSKLVELRMKMKSSRKIDPNTWATIIANLAGILLILNYERVNVIATKAFNHVPKLRI